MDNGETVHFTPEQFESLVEALKRTASGVTVSVLPHAMCNFGATVLELYAEAIRDLAGKIAAGVTDSTARAGVETGVGVAADQAKRLAQTLRALPASSFDPKG